MRYEERNIKITEYDNLKSHACTDSNGYFKIMEKNNFGGNLIVDSTGGIIDIIRPITVQHGEKMAYHFINGKVDMLYLKY